MTIIVICAFALIIVVWATKIIARWALPEHVYSDLGRSLGRVGSIFGKVVVIFVAGVIIWFAYDVIQKTP